MSDVKYLSTKLQTSPHLKKNNSVEKIMRHVLFALIPVCAFSVYAFGLSALLLLSASVAGSVLTELFYNYKAKKENTLNDYTAAITGLLLGMTLPPGFALWMAFAGGAISIVIGKLIFGGMGFNLFNPALVGRAFLQASFPVAITTWHAPFASERFSNILSSTLALPFMTPIIDGVTAATPLAAWKFEAQVTDTMSLFLGNVAGSAGETSLVLIVLGGLYLAFRKMLDWKIPASILLTVIVVSSLFHFSNSVKFQGPVFMLGSGGLMLGAFFMATDMVSSPVTPIGVIVYGFIIGSLTVIIRTLGGLPEGVMYAILLGNASTPMLDRLFLPRVYGTKLRGKK